MQNFPAGTQIAGTRTHDGRLVVAMDLGRETPLPLHGKEFRYGLFELNEKTGAITHVEGGIMANSKKAIQDEFQMYCDVSSGLAIGV